jgi:hypothetical protein
MTTEYEIIGQYLQDHGITTQIFYDELDDDFPECICISDYFAANTYDQVTGEDTPDYKNFNIIVRMLDKKECYILADQIYRTLKNLSNITMDSIFFMDFHAKGPPSLLGKTESGYTERTINFECQLVKTS